MSAELTRSPRLGDDDIVATARQLAHAGGEGFAAPQLLAVLCAPDATARDVLRLIGPDPGLTARVLRVANSALHGVRGKVATVDHAVRLLGLDAVRGIAAAACFNHSVSRAAAGGPVDVDLYQAHCIATAVAAESLARTTGRARAAEAFVAGLLHDFGVLVQLRAGARMLRIGAEAAAAAPPVDVLRAQHEHYGAVALEAWGLPPALVAVARHHHEPASAPAPHRDLATLVIVADCASRAGGFDFDGDGGPSAFDPVLAERAGVRGEDFEAVSGGLNERVAGWRAALG